MVNGIAIREVIIDPHYQEKHSESVNDDIILNLVRALHGKTFEPDGENPPYRYFVTDGIEYRKKCYRLIWLLENHQIYIGVVNAYRRS